MDAHDSTPCASHLYMDHQDLDVDCPDAALLPQARNHEASDQQSAMTRLGMLRAYYLGAVVCLGYCIFAPAVCIRLTLEQRLSIRL